MKHLLILIAFVFAFGPADAQLVRFDSTITVTLPHNPNHADSITREAEFITLVWNTRNKTVEVEAVIHHYKNGQKLETEGIRSFHKTIVANLTHFCDAQGNVIDTATYNGIYFYEYEFYCRVAFTSPVIIKQLIIQSITSAAAAGKYD